MDGNRPKWMNMDEYEWYGWKWMNMDETGIIWNHILHNSYAAQISKQLLTSTELLGSQRLISASRPGNQHFLSRERFINFFPFQGNYMTCPVPLIWKPIGTTAMNHSAWNWSPHPVSAMRNMPNKNCPEGKCPWREMSQQRPPLASCSIASHCREHYELLACVTGISASHHITDYYWSLQDILRQVRFTGAWLWHAMATLCFKKKEYELPRCFSHCDARKHNSATATAKSA